MSDIMTKDGYPYAFDPKGCESCAGNCCIGESGYIWINKQEMAKLSDLLDISIMELKEKYLNKIDYKYSIKEIQLDTNNYACTFFDLEKKQCGIYHARPVQCRTFPFWDYFQNRVNEVKEECPAIRDI